MKRGYKPAGFTVVELLIVIVVIAILATITIVTYTDVQERARDAQRKTDISNIAKGLNTHNANNGSYLVAGSNCGSSGNGWYGLDYDGATTTLKSISQCLIDADSISKELRDPSGLVNCGTGTICRAYMKDTCTAGTFLYASLESEPAGQDGPANAACSTGWDTAYGMNYVIKID